MGDQDTFALLSSMVEAHTQEIASLKTTEPTVNSFEEGYEYNQYSNTFVQEWMDQPSFSYMDKDKDFQISQYDDQQQFQQQYYQEQFEQPPLQHYPISFTTTRTTSSSN